MVGATGTRNATGQSATALTLDEDQHWSVQAKDMAGNTVTQERLFRVVNIHQEPLIASIAPVTATTPVCPAVPIPACTLTFNAVVAEFGTHGITISSSAHRGEGTFTRPVDLSATRVRWHTPGGTRDNVVDLRPAEAEVKITLDDAFNTSFTIPAASQRVALGDVTVHVPPDALPGSVATLQMPATTVAPTCADTSAASDPRTCGESDTVNAEPLPDPYQEMAPAPERPAEDTNCDAACEEYLASVTVPAEIIPLPEDGLISGTPRPTGNGDVSWTAWTPGEIMVKVAVGQDMLHVAAAHGALPAEILGDTGPFDDAARTVGLDRWYTITVPPGTEKARVSQYVVDPAVEYVQLSPTDDVLPLAIAPDPTNDPGITSDRNAGTTCGAHPPAYCGKQWNLSLGTNEDSRDAWKQHGIWPTGAWNRVKGLPRESHLGSRPIDTAYIDSGFTKNHDDHTGRIGGEWTFPDDSPKNPDGSDRNDNWTRCYGKNNNYAAQHGTWVMGMNANTNNGTGLAGASYGGYAIPIQWGVHPPSSTSGSCAPFASHTRRADWIKKAVEIGAEVINISFGAKDEYQKECDEIERAYILGVVVVVAQPYGGGADHIWPSSCASPDGTHKYQLVVSATDVDGLICKCTEGGLNLADVAAPGAQIWTTGKGGNQCCTANNDYVSLAAQPTPIAGASVAVPQVAGLVHILTELGVPRYAARNAPRTSATPISAACDGKGESCFGKINMSRAVGSAVHNGVFEVWTNSSSPTWWSDNSRGCTTSQGADASPGNHGYSMVISCRRSSQDPTARSIKTSTVRVNAGWRYQFIARARRSADNSDASSFVAFVCFFAADPTDPQTPPDSSTNPAGCADSQSNGEVLRNDGWSSWAFQADAPTGKTWAQVRLQTNPSYGTVSWDDVGLYAIGETPKK